MDGKVVHFEIPADDLERARSFYSAAFGWRCDTVPEMDYVLATTTPTDSQGAPAEPGCINGGITKRERPVLAPLVTIDVSDIDEALNAVEQLGGKRVQDRQPVGEMGYTGYFSDTEGNTIGLWQTA